MSVGPPRWTWRSMSSTACWSWDARTTSAWPNPGPGWGHCARIPDPCNTAAHGLIIVHNVNGLPSRPFHHNALRTFPGIGQLFDPGSGGIAVLVGLLLSPGLLASVGARLGGCHLVCPKRHCLSEAQLHSPPLSRPELEHRYGKIFSMRVFMRSIFLRRAMKRFIIYFYLLFRAADCRPL